MKGRIILLLLVLFYWAHYLNSIDDHQNTILAAPSIWINGKGSELIIDSFDAETNMIKGTYINTAEGFPCQNIEYPLSGWLYNSIISFSVIWKSSEESCDALTTWIGYIKDDTLITSWQLINKDMKGLAELLTGEDDFKLVEEERKNFK